jgi:hypothetical protein
VTFATREPIPDARLDRLIAEVLADRANDAYVAALPVEVVRDRVAPRVRSRLRSVASPTRVGRTMVLVAALGLLIAALAAAWAIGSRPRPIVPWLPAAMTDAINDRDVARLRSLFASGAILEYPSVDARIAEGRVFQNPASVDKDGFLASWVLSLDDWGLQAELRPCRPGPEETIECEVRTRWDALRLEIGETWTFAAVGEHVTRLDMVRSDPVAPGGALPMRLGDLDAWMDWLRQTHPDQAARLLPTGPDLFGWHFFRFGLDASPSEIRASIIEYLESTD